MFQQEVKAKTLRRVGQEASTLMGTVPTGSPRQQVRGSGFNPGQLCSKVHAFARYSILAASSCQEFGGGQRVCFNVLGGALLSLRCYRA